MLSGYQCEIIAYVTDGDIICRDCAVAEYSTVAIEKLDAGLGSTASGHLSPLIRYSIDEISGERTYDYAGERVDRFVDEHPQLHALFALNGDRQRDLIDRWAQRHDVPECCGRCTNAIE